VRKRSQGLVAAAGEPHHHHVVPRSESATIHPLQHRRDFTPAGVAEPAATM